MSRQSLFPGFSQVEAFGQEEEYEHLENGEVDEEVVYVTLDLGQVEPTLVPSTSSYRLIVSYGIYLYKLGNHDLYRDLIHRRRISNFQVQYSRANTKTYLARRSYSLNPEVFQIC